MTDFNETTADATDHADDEGLDAAAEKTTRHTNRPVAHPIQ